MTPTPTDPAAIDLEQLGQRYLNASTAGQAGMVNHLIAAVEALRERVAVLETAEFGGEDRAEAAEAREAELVGALEQIILTWVNCDSPTSATANAMESIAEAALARLDLSTIAPAKADAGGEEG